MSRLGRRALAAVMGLMLVTLVAACSSMDPGPPKGAPVDSIPPAVSNSTGTTYTLIVRAPGDVKVAKKVTKAVYDAACRNQWLDFESGQITQQAHVACVIGKPQPVRGRYHLILALDPETKQDQLVTKGTYHDVKVGDLFDIADNHKYGG